MILCIMCTAAVILPVVEKDVNDKYYCVCKVLCVLYFWLYVPSYHQSSICIYGA